MLDIGKECTGCGMCTLICPQDCIQMKYTKEGFRVPTIDEQKCIKCYRCEKKCPVLNDLELSIETKAVAAKNKECNVRMNSSSGGVFSALAEEILSNNGVVCAARYDDEFNVIHEVFGSVEDIPKYQGAKYTQSKVEHCFFQIKEILNSDRYVLFVGTPCQVAALRSYLDKKYDKLLLIDMICHGVPSPKVWRKYLEERSIIDANGEKIKYINLRSKVTGWSNYAYSVEFTYENQKIYSVCQNKDAYMRGFVSNLYLRESCSNCKFKGVERCSDITLGDFWGVWNHYPEFDDNKGISALLIHTEKGIKIWERVSSKFVFRKVSTEDIIQYNPSIINVSVPHSKRSEFFERLEQGEAVEEIIRECTENQKMKTPLIKRLINYLIS